MNDTDKELYFVKEINEDDKSVVVQGLMYSNQFKIKNDTNFYKFAKSQIEIAKETNENIFFTFDFDKNGKPINYGKC